MKQTIYTHNGVEDSFLTPKYHFFKKEIFQSNIQELFPELEIINSNSPILDLYYIHNKNVLLTYSSQKNKSKANSVKVTLRGNIEDVHSVDEIILSASKKQELFF